MPKFLRASHVLDFSVSLVYLNTQWSVLTAVQISFFQLAVSHIPVSHSIFAFNPMPSELNPINFPLVEKCESKLLFYPLRVMQWRTLLCWLL